jgi:hypothetical protein
LDGQDQAATGGAAAVFAEVDPLPGAQSQSAVVDREGEGAAQERRLGVGRHIVGSLTGVSVWEILRGQPGQDTVEIERDIGVGILVDRQRGGGVLEKDVEQADPDVDEFREGIEDPVGDEVEPGGKGGQLDLSLRPGHEDTARNRD